MNKEITGIFENFIFINEDTDYAIGKIYSIEDSKDYIIKGNISSFKEGDFITIICMEKHDSNYGVQYIVKECYPAEPYGEKGLKAYIKSRFHGIGVVTSEHIFNYFGMDSISILDSNPGRIHEIKRIQKSKRKIIEDGWREAREKDGFIRSLIISLQEIGYGIRKVNSIINTIKNIDNKSFLQNPYILMDFCDVNFKVADEFAIKIGFPLNSNIRILRGIEYYSLYNLSDGNCYIEKNDFINSMLGVLYNDESLINEGIYKAIKLDYIKEYKKNNTTVIMPGILDKYEANISEKITNINNNEGRLSHINIEYYMELYNKNKKDITLNNEQCQAVSNALNKGFSIITGGPGTGKTTIIKTIIDVINNFLDSSVIKLMAPTGKAAKRMYQSTGVEASTIHRAIYSIGGNNKIEADIVIVDETSMVDLETMSWLFDHIDERSNVVFLGDADQLKSVGPGQVLKDMIDSEKISFTILKEIYRFDEGYIKKNSYNINNGNPLILPNVHDKESDFYFMKFNQENFSVNNYANYIVNSIVKLYTKHLPEKKNINPINDIQVLAPMKKGILGVYNINKEIQNKVNPVKNKEDLIITNKEGDSLRRGDKVIQTVNNYSKGIFNGEVGIIKNVDYKKRKIVVNYDIGNITYDQNDFNQLELAYAMTIHKSQGSEFDYLILPMFLGYNKMLGKQIFYTAVTRGKKMVVVIGDEKAVDISIKNSDKKERRTLLKERIQDKLIISNQPIL